MVDHDLRFHALAALQMRIPAKKAAAARMLTDALFIDPDAAITPSQAIPGRPDMPELVSPKKVKSRAVGSLEGRAALIHSLCHIEFNAINLALDVLWRFPGMPVAFYRDWAQVAREEGLHFALLSAHLEQMGFHYGDMPAHDGLWEMAERTRHDLLARLALVPRTLEARGLDASPMVRRKLAAVGDHDAAAIIDVILHDEIGHVATGNRWYRYLCTQRGLDPICSFRTLADRYRAPRLRGPFNLPARRAAGFSDEELALLLEDAQSADNADAEATRSK